MVEDAPVPIKPGRDGLPTPIRYDGRRGGPRMDGDIDVVVIGAGLAGLGAATALRDLGRTCVILEASGRVGGRAWTTHPAELGGVWFDMGAVWLHDAEHNPLASIGRAAGDKLLRS